MNPIHIITDFFNARALTRWNPDIAERWTRAAAIAAERLKHPAQTKPSFMKSASAEECASDKRAWANGDAPRAPVYGRIGHPEGWALEDALSALEEVPGGPKVVVARATSTGMGAVTAAIDGIMEKTRDESPKHAVVSRHLFGAALTHFDMIAARDGIEVTYIDGTNPQEWEDAVRPDTVLFFFEVPTNPLLHLIDIEAVAAIAHDKTKNRDVTVVADGSVAGALAQPVFHLGVDVVCRSETKYLAGGDSLGGFIAARRRNLGIDRIMKLLPRRDALAPEIARKHLKKMRTSGTRFKNQSDVAHDLAEYVYRTYGVSVLYPGLDSHPQKELAAKQMLKRADGEVIGGGVFTIDFGSEAQAFRAQNILLKHGASLETNFGQKKFHATHQASNTYVKNTAEQRAACGITPGLVRFSPGDAARFGKWKRAFDEIFRARNRRGPRVPLRSPALSCA